MSSKNRIKHFLGRYPQLFFPVYRLFGPKRTVEECMLSENKELVIEGFPRSANTFAVIAFRQASGRNVPMAHHLHVEAQIRGGVYRNLPVIVVIRNPEDAIRSLLVRHPKTDVKWAFSRWIQFYNSVAAVRGSVVMAQFEEVIRDYGSVINKVNKKFKTKYPRFNHTDENIKNVYQKIEEINKFLHGGRESHIARPSSGRIHLTRQVLIPDSVLVNRAVTLFDRLTRRGQV